MRASTRWALVLLALLLAAPWVVALRVLRRVDTYARFDQRDLPLQRDPADVSDAAREVADDLRAQVEAMNGVHPLRRIRRMRRWLDELGDTTHAEVAIRQVVGGPVAGEWVVPDGCDGTRRLLYVHGGGYQLGSPRSHRALTTELARRTGCAVFAVDYRLLPEHGRTDGIRDVRDAWAHLVATGPDGPAPARAAFLAGDSAGANLALSLVLWLRDTGGRAPDAVVALAPPVDATLSSPSWHDNADTDAFLGPSFSRFLWVPRPVLFVGGWLLNRVRPDDPSISPLLGDLAGLPPTLVQASDCEMLLDDAVRFANAAGAAGSPVQLQVWPGMVHVFQSFDVPEAAEALDEIQLFLAHHDPTR